MNDELMLFGGLDQSIPTEEESSWVRDRINRQIDMTIETKNLEQATQLMLSLIRIAKIAGRELSRVLYKFQNSWSVFDTNETFMEWADRVSGLHHHTVERYLRIESLLTSPEVPEMVRTELADRNFNELFPVANMVSQGFELEPDQWQEILIQPDATSIRAKVNEIKGAEPRATSLVIRMDDNGSIWAVKDNQRKFVGSLSITDESPIVQQSIERIIKNTGILR